MASVKKEEIIKAPIEFVWAALSDFGAVHSRLAPEFVIKTDLFEGGRIVTFANGMTMKEYFVSRNDEETRLCYANESEHLKHHNATSQLVKKTKNSCQFIWSADFLPDSLEPNFSRSMDAGLTIMKNHLEKSYKTAKKHEKAKA